MQNKHTSTRWNADNIGHALGYTADELAYT